MYLVVYTQFHLKSLTAQQRAAIENPNPPVAPEPVKPPSGATPFVWSLVADCVSVSHRTSALYEYADDAMVWASYAMRDVTPYQYRI